MHISLTLSLFILPTSIISNPVGPITPPQLLAAAVVEDPKPPPRWELKPLPNFPCSGAGPTLHKGTAKQDCTVLADTPTKGYRFFNSDIKSFKLCFYNQTGCAKDNFCGRTYSAMKCEPVGGKGPAVSFKVINATEKCIEGGTMFG